MAPASTPPPFYCKAQGIDALSSRSSQESCGTPKPSRLTWQLMPRTGAPRIPLPPTSLVFHVFLRMPNIMRRVRRINKLRSLLKRSPGRETPSRAFVVLSLRQDTWLAFATGASWASSPLLKSSSALKTSSRWRAAARPTAEAMPCKEGEGEEEG